MTNNRRIEKVSSLLRKEISLIIMYQLEDELILENFVSITKIELTADLQCCKVFIRSSASEIINNKIVEHLNLKKNTIRHYLSQRLSMKRIPELIFKKDMVFEKGMAVLKVLDEIRLKNKIRKESSGEKENEEN
ncbi:MAG: ribosome-binding factor A [Prochlorococcus sp. SP3034]|nr:ribosome-binding factor A [Prochlorococcus sp. SP3034]|tara:strand:- start:9216 stop:9617 length:402 start_codon:yes stop_codon:yes gene_type:complete